MGKIARSLVDLFFREAIAVYGMDRRSLVDLFFREAIAVYGMDRRSLFMKWIGN
ncbi:MAG: hypothetical protein IM516_05860 [Pseudanabaena sp. M158S2SP1A06QC]|nr:hypothetical protein [Pseudanabaena sp. M046S1SP1A06QC]MCA6611633.1 hypothetical protein [Pseudanabaena sp. M158S2SP1A06QC]